MNQRILFITPGLTRGGAETQLMKVARFLKTQNKDVTIIALKPLNDFKHIDFEKEGIRVLFLKSWKTQFLSNTFRLFKIVKHVKPDVVVAFMFIAILFARIMKLRYKFQLISSIRNSVISNKWKHAFKLTASLDDVIVYNSNASKLNFETQSLAKRNGIIINNAVAMPPVNQLAAPRSASKPFVWVTMAHFRPSKDYRTLFKAIALIKNENFRVDCLGHIRDEWPYELIAELGITDKVRILGFQSNPADYLKEADAFVLSSFWEGSPNAMLEAMSYCKPIVASAVDGIEEFLAEADCGFLVNGGDAQDLASTMAHMMCLGSESRLKLGQKGRHYVEQNFSEEQVMEKWLNVVC
ncbi:MAG TPA: glycosyltransferase [Sphingobacteriaceae bacterium]